MSAIAPEVCRNCKAEAEVKHCDSPACEWMKCIECGARRAGDIFYAIEVVDGRGSAMFGNYLSANADVELRQTLNEITREFPELNGKEAT